MIKIIDAHSHLWLQQDTTWNGKPIHSLKNGRSLFLGEVVQMLPPFMIDGTSVHSTLTDSSPVAWPIICTTVSTSRHSS